MGTRIFLIIFLSAFLFSCAGSNNEITTLKQNGGWCWYQDERAILAGDELVFASVKCPEGDVDISSWNIKTGDIKTKVMHPSFNVDDHAEPALLKLDNGNILAAWSSHGNALQKSFNKVLYYTATTRGADITEWEKIQENPYQGCYNNLYKLSAENNRIYDFSRSYGYNPNWYYSDDAGKTFNYGGRFLFWKIKKGDPKYTGIDGNRPYIKFTSNNIDTIHFGSTEDHPRAYDNSIYHGFLKGGKLYKTDGTFVSELSKEKDKAPSPTDFTKVFEGDADNVAWIMDMHLDEKSNPTLLFSVQKDAGKFRRLRSHAGLDLRYYYARWDGKQWAVNQMSYAGRALYDSECDYSGLGAINPANVNEVFISTDACPSTNKPLISEADGRRHYEIFRGSTSDFGKTWKWESVTKNSNADNLRPIIPVVDKSSPLIVLWLRGSLKTYMDYKLDVVGKVFDK